MKLEYEPIRQTVAVRLDGEDGMTYNIDASFGAWPSAMVEKFVRILRTGAQYNHIQDIIGDAEGDKLNRIIKALE